MLFQNTLCRSAPLSETHAFAKTQRRSKADSMARPDRTEPRSGKQTESAVPGLARGLFGYLVSSLQCETNPVRTSGEPPAGTQHYLSASCSRDAQHAQPNETRRNVSLGFNRGVLMATPTVLRWPIRAKRLWPNAWLRLSAHTRALKGIGINEQNRVGFCGGPVRFAL